MTSPVGPGRFVGARVQRREDPRLLTGHGTYVDDVVLPGMLHAAFVRSPIARGRIVTIDATAARAAEGVIAVWSGADLNADATPLWDFSTPAHGFPAIHPLAVEEVHYVGDPVAIVIAENRYLAEDAAELVDIEYDWQTPVIGRHAALSDAEIVHTALGTNVAWEQAAEDPSVEQALAACAHVVTETISHSRHLPVPMEPRGLVVDWQPATGQLTIHYSSQNPHQDRSFYAAILGVPEHKVRVIMKDVGGGFGQKIYALRDECAVAVASKRLALPVKWIEDRVENLSASTSARDEQMTVTLGFDADHRLQVARVAYLADIGAHPRLPPFVLGTIAANVFPGPYRFAHYGWSGRSVYSNTTGVGAYRGPWMMETTAREVVMDIAARQFGVDPAALRRINTIAADDLPYTSASGAIYDRISPLPTLEAALEAIDYDGFRERQRQARAEGRHLGIGISHYIEPTAGGTAGTGSTEVATVRVLPSGKVHVLMGTGSHGHSLETTMVQVVADQLGVPLEDVELLQGDTEITPYGGGTVGSRSAVMGGGVARLSALKVREKALAIAAHLMEAAPEDLEINDAVISVAGAPGGATMTLAQVATAAYTAPATLPPGCEPGLEAIARYASSGSTHANSTQICTCEVDITTGEVTLLDYVVGEDCGVMINPTVVEGQIAGGVAQGIGGALLEHMPYDTDGNPGAVTFKDYLMPTTDTVPDIRYVHLETPSNSPGGHKGVGEGGAVGAPAAVHNAIADALAPLGLRITAQPLTPDRLLALIDAATAAPNRKDH